MSDMLKYEDCGLKNIWLASGFRYEDVDGLGPCLEIYDIDGLHRTIGHHLVDYKRRLTGVEIRFLRLEMGMSQKRLGDCLGVDEQSTSLWERGKRRPTVAAERMLRLMYLEHIHGTTRVTELITQWNDTDRQKDEARQVFEETEAGWRLAA
ncbi:MAG: transcriptional regulator [Candidatus Accumulibacter meliphilus]|jgi:DNA-binding transcriptional regulator YiaG|uniref:Transcriptional regulator n=2 Tax=Candidatus Accumulibacter TaxID=327159 RepID=A0A369XQP3_9PROT|nr:MAG: transcriptional regulator [Candidatus Accumulibacter meliphilus]